MKEFHCGALVPGCEWHTRHDDSAEIIQRATDHMRQSHPEMKISETTVEAIRSRITKADAAA